MATALSIFSALAALALAGWLYLLLGRRFFWLARERLTGNDYAGLDAGPGKWPRVVAVVPARDEADVVDRAVESLLRQDYPGEFSIVLCDDGSADGTADVARQAAARTGNSGRLLVVAARPTEAGWTGKMWAVSEGLAAARATAPGTAFVWLTDADIAHAPDELRRLVAKAEAKGCDLVSLMVLLHCRSAVEKLLIPAFVFFFQKLYPFPAVNDPESPIAGAAGGSMLVRASALDRAGGIAAIRGELIDDCALAARIKRHGPIWLGIAEESRSLRPYGGLGDIWRMVARTAYTQLRHSPAMVAGAVLGMAILYLTPPLALAAGVAFGDAMVAGLGGAGLALMWLAYWPTWRLYGGIAWQFPALPVAALLYTLMTVDSALRHRRGRGGGWKGRTFAPPPAARNHTDRS